MPNKRMSRVAGWGALLALLVMTTGCGGLFDIENPGQILDSDLNDPDLIGVLITGLSSDVSDMTDELGFAVARISDEVAGSGSYSSTIFYRTGVADQGAIGGIWDQAHEARWMAQLHKERLAEVLEPATYSGSDDIARAFVFAGVAHRSLGENYCQVVYSDPAADDYGSLQPRTVAFDSASANFTAALSYGSGEFDEAAHAGLASVYAAQGNWAAAVAEAQMVSDDFEFYSYYDVNDNSNVLFVESDRGEISAFGALAGTYSPQDPRAPFTDCTVPDACQNSKGADGVTDLYRQEKYDTRDVEMVTLSGKEARLIEAEAALRNNDLVEFTAQINAVRALYGLPAIAQPGAVGALEYPNTYDDGWSILDAERHLTLWLEGRRLWDLHRWDHPFLNGGTVVWPGEVRRDSCMPVPESECSYNPNFTCQEAASGTNQG